MKRNASIIRPLLTAGLLLFTATSLAQSVTPQERQDALRYLHQTRDNLTEALKNLSAGQWDFKPAPDRWSVAGILEHLAVVEDLVSRTLANFDAAAVPAAGRDAKQIDIIILKRMPDRANKAQAPESIVPTGRWSPAVAFERFLSARHETAAFLTSARDLRAHVIDHPAFGPLDGYQWALLLAAHTERHTKQILELKADPRFPSR